MTADYEKSKRKRPNAMKHGVFASMAILPEEDLTEYEALFETIRDEWSPEGPTEIDAVYTLTNCVWRKRRIKEFIAKKVHWRLIDPNHPGFDPGAAFVITNAILKLHPEHLETLIEESPALRKHLEKRFPEHPPRDLLEPVELAKKFNINDMKVLYQRGRATKPREVRSLHRADILGDDLFWQELAMEERLDAMIDRAVKRLMQAKGVKQMLASPSLNGQAQQPKSISNSKQAEGRSSTQEH